MSSYKVDWSKIENFEDMKKVLQTFDSMNYIMGTHAQLRAAGVEQYFIPMEDK